MLRNLLPPVLLLLCACHVQVDERDVALRHDGAADTLDALLVYRGVAATEHAAVGAAYRELGPMLSGHRMFTLGPFFQFDLDDEKATYSASDQALVDGVKLVDEGLFHDTEGRLSGFQRFHVARAADVIHRVDRLIDAAVAEELAKPERPDATESGSLSLARTRARWLDAARAPGGWDWLELEDGVLVARLPLDPADVSALLVQLAPDLTEDASGGAVLRQLLLQVSTVRIADGVAVLRLEPDPSGVVHLHFAGGIQGKWSADLQDRIDGSQHASMYRPSVRFEDLLRAFAGG